MKTETKRKILEHAINSVITLFVTAILLYSWFYIKEIASGKLRPGYPSYIYKCEYLSEYKGNDGFFGLFAQLPRWSYVISFANLSRKNINDIDLSMNFGSKYNAIYIYPVACQLQDKPKKTLKNNSFTLVGSNTDQINMLCKEISKGRSVGCIIVICSKERPSIADFSINIASSAGTFEKITALKWEEIGWLSKAK